MTARNNPWADDKLGRQEEARTLLRFISGRIAERRARNSPASYVLNLNSKWGEGKTFFLTRLREDLQSRGAPVAFVNAWQTDFSDDPLTAIMSAVDDGLRPFLGKPTIKKAWRAAVRSGGSLAISLTKNVAGKLVSKYAGDFVDDLVDVAFERPTDATPQAEADDPLGVEKGVEEVVDKLADSALERMMKAFRSQQQSIDTFKTQLGKVANSLPHQGDAFQPIYILIDELDRCRPLYAIRMLEAVKHLFDTDGVIFIIATDTEQLAESVRAVYGTNFESSRYLYRFFDRTFRFRNPDASAFIEYLFGRYNIPRDKLASPSEPSVERLAFLLFDDLGASLRDMDQCFDMLHTVCTLWDKPVRLEFPYLLALIILYHSARQGEYDRLSGKVDAPWDPAPMSHSSVLWTQRRGPYNAPNTVKTTTMQLLDAYKRCLRKSLPDLTGENLGDNPAQEWVRQRLREEFSLLHHNSFHPGTPVPSVINDYHKYVELAVRFEREESQDEEEEK